MCKPGFVFVFCPLCPLCAFCWICAYISAFTTNCVLYFLVVKWCCLLQRITEIIPGLTLITLLDLYTHWRKSWVAAGQTQQVSNQWTSLNPERSSKHVHSLLHSLWTTLTCWSCKGHNCKKCSICLNEWRHWKRQQGPGGHMIWGRR